MEGVNEGSDAEEEARRFLQPDETAGQLLDRTYVEPLHTGLPLIDRFLAFRGGQVLEVASAAGAGRTTALLQVAATCILPQVAGGVTFGGKGGTCMRMAIQEGSGVRAAWDQAGQSCPWLPSSAIPCPPAAGVLFLDLDAKLDLVRLLEVMLFSGGCLQ